MSSPDRTSLVTLPAKYSLIYRAFGHTSRYPRHPFAHWGFECGDGWYTIIDELSAWLETEGRLLKIAGRSVPLVTQVKEKFGGLCFYVRQFPRNRYFAELLPRVTEAEMKSITVCEICGQAGTLRSAGYCQTLCDRHAAERECHHRERAEGA